MIYLLVEVLIFVISLIIAKKMVRKRSALAKGMAIGKDDEETKTNLLDIAQIAYTEREIQIPQTCEECTITITGKENKITSIKVENQRTMIHQVFEEGNCKINTIDKAFSECAATYYVAVGLWTWASLIVCIYGLLSLMN